jgi:energy-converting hydrogenase Eha subunit G
MNAKLVAWLVLPVVGLIVAGWLALLLLKALLGVVVYLLVGAAVVGGGVYLYRRTKRAIGPHSRAARRIEAARATYRQRNH